MTAPTELRPDQSPLRSRRALLAGALGGLGALAASAMARVSPAAAVDGDPVIQGQTNTAAFTTTVESVEDNVSALWGNASATTGVGVGVRGSTASAGGWGVWGVGPTNGVRGESPAGIGVHGQSSSGHGVRGISSSSVGVRGISNLSAGVLGESNSDAALLGVGYATDHAAVVGQSIGHSTGLQGYSGTTELPAAKPKTGIYGRANQDTGSRGVIGESTAGQGVRGEATSGVGLYGTASSGYALRTNGRLKADKVSGVATIPAGSTSKTFTPSVTVTSASFVLLTPRANLGSRGLWFTTNTTANTITIRMSSKRSSNTRVAWLLLG